MLAVIMMAAALAHPPADVAPRTCGEVCTFGRTISAPLPKDDFRISDQLNELAAKYAECTDKSLKEQKILWSEDRNKIDSMFENTSVECKPFREEIRDQITKFLQRDNISAEPIKVESYVSLFAGTAVVSNLIEFAEASGKVNEVGSYLVTAMNPADIKLAMAHVKSFRKF
jgi:hypothetical protein